MLSKPSSSAFKAIIGAVLFASFITVGCNNSKEEAKEEPAKTEEAAPATTTPATIDTTNPGDTGVNDRPGATGNKDAPPPPPSSN